MLKLFPWKFFFSLIIRVILYYIEKDNNKDARNALLLFVDGVDDKAPIKLNKKYREKIRILKEQLREEEIKLERALIEIENYKEAYEELLKNDCESRCKNRSIDNKES